MYYRGVQYQNNNQNDAFEYLSRKFADRGLARQARASADSYGAEIMYASRGSNSAPLTLGEFEQNYRSRSFYGAGVIANTQRAANQSTPQTQSRRPATKPSQPPRPSATATQQRRAEQTRAKTPVLRNEASFVAPVRRAVKKNEEKKPAAISTLARNFRHLPVSAMLTVVICAVSLMFIVGSSVLLSDASNDYVDMQNEISTLAKEERELLIALEVKNDLRTIEDIAVNKLGMVKKDLVTRQYISLGDEDMIETFEDEKTNVGLSTLLSAISGGK
ncbi:MAG: hypothetical protein E7671_00030 [Ruminococcaceae bacterium]|nr:hypothetical protein [Oscillospiraceae bacterium]